MIRILKQHFVMTSLAAILMLSLFISGVSAAQYSTSLTATTSEPEGSPANSPLSSQPILRTITQLAIPPLTQVDPQAGADFDHGLTSPVNNTPQPNNQSQTTALVNATLTGATNRTQQIGDTYFNLAVNPLVSDSPTLNNGTWGQIEVLVNASLGQTQSLWFGIDDNDSDYVWDTVYIDFNGDDNMSDATAIPDRGVVTLLDNNFTVFILNASQVGGDPVYVDLGLLSYYRDGGFSVDMDEDQTLEILNFTLVDLDSNGVYDQIDIDLDKNNTFDSYEKFNSTETTITVNGYYFELYWENVTHNATIMAHYHYRAFNLDLDGDGVSIENESIYAVFIDNNSINVFNVSCFDLNGDQNITQDELLITTSVNFIVSLDRAFNFAWDYALSANITALSYFESGFTHTAGQLNYVLVDADSDGVYDHIDIDADQNNSYASGENATLDGNVTIDTRLYRTDFAGNGSRARIFSETYYNGTLNLLDGDYLVILADNNSNGVYNDTGGYAIKIDINNDGVFEDENEGEFQIGSLFYGRDGAEHVIVSVAADGSTVVVRENTYESSSVWIFGAVSGVILVIGIATFFKTKPK
ncbi:MAG: hypothetical protein ACFFBS_06800 [Promethearchaeota archaeon]